jgi:alkanesulfonate monooxygenase SsuD/methylene tetrahydromethanopterin reductase-like flavin-dependent oxidoreductase (luciferase family)
MAEALQIIRSYFVGGTVSFEGKHYRIHGLDAAPSPVQKPHPPILLGGGGRRMLQLAAREADIVGVNYKTTEGRVNSRLVGTGVAGATDEKLGWIREAAGGRLDQIELSVSVFVANVTEDRVSFATALATSVQQEPSDVLETPHFLIGTVEQIVDDLLARRERYGISYIMVPGGASESLAPVVKRLAGK